MNSSSFRPPGERAGLSLVRGIVLTHGSMCHGMVDAVRKIAGAPDDALEGVSNEGLGPEDLYQMVAEKAGTGPSLIFTDLPSGSCAVAARFACRDPARRQVIFGANLPMLLDFVFHRELPLEALVERLLEKGRSEIRTLERPPATGGDADGHRSSAGG
jgi:mannose/fructose-specific phosphotransferase system component IIA